MIYFVLNYKTFSAIKMKRFQLHPMCLLCMFDFKIQAKKGMNSEEVYCKGTNFSNKMRKKGGNAKKNAKKAHGV